MIRPGPFPGPFPDHDAATADLRDLDRQSADRDDGTATGRNRADVDLGSRSDAFQAALRRHDLDDALLTNAGSMMAPPPFVPAVPVPVAGTAEAEPSPRLLAVVDACARALATELHLRAGGPVAIELMPEAGEGLGLVRVTIDAGRLSVEVAPAAGATAQTGLLEAARTLADRLARRFPRRLIEIAELPAHRDRHGT